MMLLYRGREGPSVMDPRAEAEQFLARWAHAHETREPDKAADLYLRDPAPLVAFSDGARAQDWLDVRVRIAHDLSHAMVERVEIRDVVARSLDIETIVGCFGYARHVRDRWGPTPNA